jgi:predicted membrane metal-binding protein
MEEQVMANEPSSVDIFLTPEAMLTPGMAGALTMMITNGLTANFYAPRALVGLAISFLFGLLVFAAAKKWWQNCIYYVLNSLVIFCVALGANTAGLRTSEATSMSFMIAPVYAQERTVETPQGSSDDDVARLLRQKEELQKQLAETEKELQKKNVSTIEHVEKKKGFFEPWGIKVPSACKLFGTC